MLTAEIETSSIVCTRNGFSYLSNYSNAHHCECNQQEASICLIVACNHYACQCWIGYEVLVIMWYMYMYVI